MRIIAIYFLLIFIACNGRVIKVVPKPHRTNDRTIMFTVKDSKTYLPGLSDTAEVKVELMILKTYDADQKEIMIYDTSFHYRPAKAYNSVFPFSILKEIRGERQLSEMIRAKYVITRKMQDGQQENELNVSTVLTPVIEWSGKLNIEIFF